MITKSQVRKSFGRAVAGKQQPKHIVLLKRCVWIYYFLLLFEGGLRKWVLPGLATPLLVVRDPFVILALIIAFRNNVLKLNGYLAGMTAIGIVSFILAVTVAHGNLAVGLYGARILLLHFPLMFVIQKVFTREDILQMGRITLMIAMPMALLTALQFYSPQSAWVNRGVGGDIEGAGFSGALGFFRPPGTFSFTNGNTLFFSFVGVFVFYFWLSGEKLNKLILWGASAALFVAIPLSISRGLLFQIAITVLFGAIVIFKKPQNIGKLFATAVALALMLAILSKAAFFQTATAAFTTRFEVANRSEGGMEGVLLDRYLGGLWFALKTSLDHPFFGIGLGAGTNAGSGLLTGESHFLGGEGEWGRIVSELGPVLGLIVIFIRMGLTLEITSKSYKKLGKGDILPWMMLSFGLLTLLQGSWSQPTSLGFCTLIGGLLLAALDNKVFRRVIKRGRVVQSPPVISTKS